MKTTEEKCGEESGGGGFKHNRIIFNQQRGKAVFFFGESTIDEIDKPRVIKRRPWCLSGWE